MKETKQHFDDLADKIRKGEKVSFGQMETLFAQAFMTKFLENLQSDKAPKQPTEDEEESNEEEQDPLQKAYYQLNLLRAVSAAVGVRASIKDLTQYVNLATQNRDWDLLSKTLSLSQEGKMPGIYETAALEELLNGNEEGYEEMLKRAEAPNFTPEIVNPFYAKLLCDGNQNDLMGYLNEITKVPFTPEVYNEAYNQVVAECSWEKIAKVRELLQSLGIQPTLRDDAKLNMQKNLVKLVNTEERMGYVARCLREFEGLFKISTDKEFMAQLLHATIEKPDVEAMRWIYFATDLKLTEPEAKQAYEHLFDWNEGSRHEMVTKLLETTGVCPPDDLLQGVYNHLLARGRPNCTDIEKIIEKTGKTPRFSQHTIETFLAQCDLALFLSVGCKILKDSGQAVSPERITKKLEAFARDWQVFDDCALYSIKKLCNEYSMEVPLAVAANEIRGITQEFHSSLHRGRNLLGALEEYTGKLKEFRKTYPEVKPDRDDVTQKAYAKCFGELLAVASYDKSWTYLDQSDLKQCGSRFKELIEIIGASVSQASIDLILDKLADETCGALAKESERLKALRNVEEVTGIGLKPSREYLEKLISKHKEMRNDQEKEQKSLLKICELYNLNKMPMSQFSDRARTDIFMIHKEAFLLYPHDKYNVLIQNFNMPDLLRINCDFRAEELRTLRANALKSLKSFDAKTYDQITNTIGHMALSEEDRKGIHQECLQYLKNCTHPWRIVKKQPEPEEFKKVEEVAQRAGIDYTRLIAEWQEGNQHA